VRVCETPAESSPQPVHGRYRNAEHGEYHHHRNRLVDEGYQPRASPIPPRVSAADVSPVAASCDRRHDSAFWRCKWSSRRLQRGTGTGGDEGGASIDRFWTLSILTI
jgi:hypothetical protein